MLIILAMKQNSLVIQMKLFPAVILLVCLSALPVRGVSLLHLSDHQDQAETASNEQGPAQSKAQPVSSDSLDPADPANGNNEQDEIHVPPESIALPVAPKGLDSEPTQAKNEQQDPQSLEYYPGTNLLPVASFGNDSATDIEDDGSDNQSPELDPKPLALPLGLNQSDRPSPMTDHVGREKRSSPPFDLGPNGEECILSASGSGDPYYDHEDPSGVRCKCDLCNPGHILVEECTCNLTALDIPQPSLCRLVERGRQMMPTRNKCTTGYDCKVCEHPWRVQRECEPAGPEDTVCDCVDEYYPLMDDCRPIPHCGEGYEPARGYGENQLEMKCQPCPEGYSQPQNNSIDQCRRNDPVEPTLPIDNPTESLDTNETLPGNTPNETLPGNTEPPDQESPDTNETLPGNTPNETLPGNTEPPDQGIDVTMPCMTWEVVLGITIVSSIVCLVIGCCLTQKCIERNYDICHKGSTDLANFSWKLAFCGSVLPTHWTKDNSDASGASVNNGQDGPNATTSLTGNNQKKFPKGQRNARKRGGKTTSL